MSSAQNQYWAPTSPPYAQHMPQHQQNQSHPHHQAQYQPHHPQQQHFLPPTAHPSQTHQQYQQHQPQLQLEHHYDQLAGLEGLTGHLPMSPPQPMDQQSIPSTTIPQALPQLPPSGINGVRNIAGPSVQPILGVGQGPGNASPKYTAATATALSATDPSQFAFASVRGGSPSGSPSQQHQQHGRGSPSASGSPNSHGADPFSTPFSFGPAAHTGIPPHQPGVVTGAPLVESIPPHSGLHQPRPQAQPMQQQQQQEYLHPSGYSPQHTAVRNKRPRADTAAETGSQGHDPDSDYEPFQGQSSGSIEGYTIDPNYEPYGDAYEYEAQYHEGPGFEGNAAYHPQMGQPGLMPGMLPGMGGATAQGAQGGQMGQPAQEQKPKAQGACVRCKNLKVRCEFTTDPNTCRRCVNGGHECMIPGRKKRRQPPKREHLLNQIRDQASQIQKLMEQLEEANRRQRLHHGEPPRLSLSNTPLPPPGGATPIPGTNSGATTPGEGSTASANVSASGSYIQPRPRQEVQEWITRARESIQTIGGLLDNSAFAEEEWDAEESEQDGWDEVENAYLSSGGEGQLESGSDYADAEDQGEDEITVEVPDDEGFEGYETGTVRHASPSSTLGGSAREGSAHPSQHSSSSTRRKTPQPPRLAPLPATSAAPFGLIAQMTLATKGAKGREHTGSRSPKSALSRSASVEAQQAQAQGQDHPSPVGTASDQGAGATSPRSASASGAGGGDADGVPDESGEAQAQVKLEDETAYGATAPGFFEARRGSVPDPGKLAPSRHPIPHILMRGIVAPKEVEELFKIYFDKMNLSCSLLDPVLYTAQKTYWRSPFLFTVICAIASRYYPGRPGLYEELITYAQLAAGTALISGPKTVETVSAYILLSLYPVPMRRWEEDRTWLYLGLAIRVATDLNLHVPPSVKPRNETHARELLNRTRVWLNCYNLDRSTSSWHGKQSTIADSDYLATHSEEWWNSSDYNFRNFDIHIAGYNVELRVMTEFRKKIYSSASSPTGLNKSLEINKLAAESDEKLVNMEAEWNERLSQNTDSGDEQARFRNSLIKLAYRYSRLIVLSFGFQHSFVGKAHSAQTTFFNRCYNAATDLLRVFIDELSTQKVYLKHGPEAQCVFVTFASSFLIKLLHPKYATYLQISQREEIQSLVRGIIDLLGDPEVVVDERHSPKLWARFLDGLLATPMAKVQLSPSALKGGSNLPSKARRRTTHRGGSAGASDKKRGSASPASSHASPGHGSQRGLSPETMQASPSSDPTSLTAQAQVLPAVSEEHQHAHAQGQGSVVQGPPIPQYSYDQGGDPAYHMQATAQMPQQQQHQQQQQQQVQGAQAGVHNALQMNVGEFFQQQPLFDNDLFQSMQAMPDASIWQDMTMPGFNWLGVLQAPESDTVMQDPSYMNSQLVASGNQY